MQGYYKDPAATRLRVSPEGWLDTGDRGVLTVDGNLVITGRMGDAIVLRSGERVEPLPVEMVLQESPYIREAVLVGGRRDTLGILIVPDREALRKFAEARRIPSTDLRELVRAPAVARFYQDKVQSLIVTNGIHFPDGRVPRVALLPADFEVGRELTRALTKRREVIASLYGSVIEKMNRS
jgi:long-chain acyl-CoA synthetase